jgi:hypothetical protein
VESLQVEEAAMSHPPPSSATIANEEKPIEANSNAGRYPLLGLFSLARLLDIVSVSMVFFYICASEALLKLDVLDITKS